MGCLPWLYKTPPTLLCLVRKHSLLLRNTGGEINPLWKLTFSHLIVMYVYRVPWSNKPLYIEVFALKTFFKVLA